MAPIEIGSRTAPGASRRSSALVELGGLVQVPRLLWHTPALLSGSRGDRYRVIVLPGRSTGDVTTVPLRSYLRFLGHRPEGWGLGQNHGRVDELIPLMLERVRAAAVADGRPVALVGQSMGGFIAREVARLAPEHVDRIITLGSPIFAARSRSPILAPVTAIYSRSDQVVGTSRSIDHDSRTSNVEVHSPHFTMGLDPDVWKIVADALTDQNR